MNTLNPIQNASFNKPILSVAFDSDETIIYKTPEGVNVSLNFADRLMLPIISYGGGNSLNFYWQFNSPNIHPDKQIIEIDTQPGTKSVLRAIQYTDENAILDEFNVNFINKFTIVEQNNLPIVPTTDIEQSIIAPSNFKILKNQKPTQ